MSSDAVLPAAAVTVPNLPQEIIDIVIDYSNKNTLSVLALVSRSWLRSARRHLYGRVELCNYYPSPREPGHPSASVGPFWKVDFGLEVITRSPAIASCIRFLRLKAFFEEYQYFITQGFQFLSLLPNLRTLSLMNTYWPSLRPENVQTILRGISAVSHSLEELSLTSVWFVDTADLAQFVHAFPTVKRIYFSHCGILLPATTSVFLLELPMPTLICLEHLEILHSPLQTILEIFLQRDTFKLGLKGVNMSLDTDLERSETFDIYDKFFRVIGNNLQTIGLEVCLMDYRTPDAVVQLLTYCRHLSSISIDMRYRQRFISLAWFVSVLKAAAASSLEKVTIHCSLSSARQQRDWGQVDDTLWRLPVFRMLSVVIHFINMRPPLMVDPSTRDTIHNVLGTSMPRLRQAGTLRILADETFSYIPRF